MKFEKTLVSNFDGAFRGMRNPLNSWDKTDSVISIGDLNDCCDAESMVIPIWISQENNNIEYYSDEYEELYQKYSNWLEKNGILRDFCEVFDFAFIGPKDMDLAQRLVKSGPEHCKFLRQIQVSVDITAPLYWWKEFDTYKVGTTANSTSTMHTLTKTPITLNSFEIDDYDAQYAMPEWENYTYPSQIIEYLEYLRQKYIETNDKHYWKELIRWLPESFLQTRTVTMSYANLRNIYFQRRGHKLTEWLKFLEWIASLPYAKELIMLEEEK